jgi:SAM-dependent methyltransferase
VYRRDLARIHHEGFGDFSREAAPFLLALLGRAGWRRGRVVDLGCGGGTWLRALARAGYEPAGVEPSRALARIARRTAPGARVRIASAHDVELPPCVAVTALGEVLSYCPPGGRAPDLPKLFRRVAGALPRGGVFAFDLMVRAAGPPIAYRSWRAGRDWAVLLEVSEDRRRHRLVREITSFAAAGRGRYRRGHERHVLAVSARSEVERALRAAGFTVRATSRYGALALAPRRLAFLARKR